MDKQELVHLLASIASERFTPYEVVLQLKMEPYCDVGGYSRVDFHRGIRQGVPEVTYGEGKKKEHILGATRTMLENGQSTILIAPLSQEKADFIARELPETITSWPAPAC